MPVPAEFSTTTETSRLHSINPDILKSRRQEVVLEYATLATNNTNLKGNVLKIKFTKLKKKVEVIGWLWVGLLNGHPLRCFLLVVSFNVSFSDMEFLEVLTEGLNRVLLVRGGGREVITIYSWRRSPIPPPPRRPPCPGLPPPLLIPGAVFSPSLCFVHFCRDLCGSWAAAPLSSFQTNQMLLTFFCFPACVPSLALKRVRRRRRGVSVHACVRLCSL